jgi:Zn-dependent M16 (insulinase) family peptidase
MLRAPLSAALLLLLLATCTRTPPPGAGAPPPTDLEVGTTYHGFELRRVQELPEIASRGLYFVHNKSGAQLIKLENQDDNKVFAAAFKTPPESDTGLPHILEHAVLNGSKKFTAKNPFDVLVQGSFNTFLNAFTGDDFTMYPVASTNDKDFRNLMHVYLDAVFYPRIFEEDRIFQQEGWRYELESRDAPLTTNGVVYNEMKGAFSSPTRLLHLNIGRQLFPNSPYGFSSGGLPEAITELRREDFLAFHKKHCHPSNTYLYIYGDGNTLDELAFIDAEYLNGFLRQPGRIEVATQKPLAEPVVAEVPYPVASDEGTAGKTYLSMSWVLSGAAEPVDTFLLEVLADLLVNLPGAPVREALVAAGIGGDYNASFDNLKQGVFTIIAEKADRGDRDEFRRIVTETLEQVAREGLVAKQVQGVINKKEFSLREADYGGFPKGLFYGYFGSRGWMFSDDPFRTFGFEETLKAAKKGAAAGRLEKLARDGLLTNNHAALVVVYPQPGLQDEINAATEAKLAKIKAAMSPEEIDALVASTAALKEWQRQPNTPEQLATIPMLSLLDLDSKEKPRPVRDERHHGTRVLFSEQVTSGIAYVTHYFSVQAVPQEKLPYLKLFETLLGELSTKRHGYEELNTEVNLHTGGLSTDLVTFPEVADPTVYHPTLALSCKALTPKMDELLALQSEIINETRFDDRARLREVVMQIHTGLQAMARGAGYQLASQRFAATVSPSSWFRERVGGLTYIGFVADLANNFDERADDLVRELEAVRSQVVNKPGHTVALVGGSAELEVLLAKLPEFAATLPASATPPRAWQWKPAKASEGLLSASKVQYVTQGANIRDLGHAYSGRLELLGRILSRGYLTKKVRVENGAYGAFASFSRSGVGYFGSYRDPQLQKTLDAFAGAAAFVKTFTVDPRSMTRYKIGTVARRDKPYPPRAEGMNAIRAYLTGVTDAVRQKERDEILAAEAADIQGLAPVVEAMLQNANLCVYGNEETLKANASLFGTLTPVLE